MHNPFEELWTHCYKCGERVRLKDCIPHDEKPFCYFCAECHEEKKEGEENAENVSS